MHPKLCVVIGPRLSLILGLTLSLVACQASGDDDDGPPIAPPGGGGGGADACNEDTDCLFTEGLEICEESLCVYGDRNNSMDEAQLLEYGESVDLYIAPANDEDWFRFQGTRGEMAWFRATADNDDSLDTVLIYYDSEGTEIAVNDDFERLSSVVPNSRLFTGVPEDGTYYISIQDRSTWANNPATVPKTVSDLGYSLFIDQMGATEDGPVVASEPNDEAGSASPWPITDFGTNYNLGGFFEAEGDHDWVSIDVNEKDILRLYGFPGHGGQGTTKVTVYLPDGITPIRSYEGMNWDDPYAWIPVLETGTYYLDVEDSQGGGSYDHWYVLHGAKTDPQPLDDEGNPKDPRGFTAEIEPNNTFVESTALGIGQGGDEDPGSATRWGRIGSAGDVDCWMFSPGGDAFLWASFADTGHGEETNPKLSLYDPDQIGVTDPQAAATATWDHGENNLFKLEPLTSGVWNLCVEEVDPAAGGGNRYYQLNVVIQPA